MKTFTTKTNLPVWQDRLGRGLMVLASIGALVAFGLGIAAVNTVSLETIWVELWRTFGFLVFAGMFALLALRPRLSAGVWELVFFHKLAMVITAVLLPNAPDAKAAGSADAVILAMIVVAYFCTRGWLSWRVWVEHGKL